MTNDAAAPGRFFALVAGTERYDDPSLAELRTPARDARELAALLADSAIGGYQVQSLTDEPAHLIAEEIEGFFADRHREDTAILYLSCHGVKDLDGRLRFAATNTRMNRLTATTIGADFIYELVDRCRARNVLVLLDCCYSGAYLRGHHPRSADRAALGSPGGRGRAVITSCTSLEYSFEVDTGTVGGTGVASAFTNAIISGLGTGDADLDNDGLVSLDDLYEYVYAQVRLTTPHQTPEKKWGELRGDFIIARSPRPRRAVAIAASRVISPADFPARRGRVERSMLVRQRDDRTEVALLEDGVLVEHYLSGAGNRNHVGHVYLGQVQQVLPSMGAAFVDIGQGGNAVLYTGEANSPEGESERIEPALESGQPILVQVIKNPVGQKGARLTSEISLPGEYAVYVPGASSVTGISRKLPDSRRRRLRQIVERVKPANAGVIVRAAAERADEEALSRDISILAAQWEAIERRRETAEAPALLHTEPGLAIRVVRDVFNEDFSQLIVSGDEGWAEVDGYVRSAAPQLADRLSHWDGQHRGDLFADRHIDEQLGTAHERRVGLPSGGSLAIDPTEAMTVIAIDTGRSTGQSGTLEEIVTRTNLEAAEEIVRQLRLRDIGGIITVSFIDMVQENHRELVLQRLLEGLARDRAQHQVADVASLGTVQITRKRIGYGQTVPRP